MFKLLRNKKTQKKIWIVLCILILPAFLLWGTGSNRLRNKDAEDSNTSGIVGKKISQAEYDGAVQAIRNQAIMQFGDNFFQIEKFLDIKNQAIDRAFLLREAKKRRLKVSDTEVVAFITTYPLFQVNDSFDQRTYDYMLNYYFHTQARIFEEEIRQNLSLKKLFEIITAPITLSEEQIKEAYQKENEQISVSYIASIPTDFAKDIEATNDDLENYYSQHSLDFKEPITYNVESLAIESETVKNQALEKLQKKEDLLTIAKDLNLTIKETGFFSQNDPIPAIGWSPEIQTLLAKLEIGQVSPIIKSDKNYYLLRLKEKKEPHIPAFENIKDKVKDTIIKQKSQEIAQDKIKQCLTALLETSHPLEGNVQDLKENDFEKYAKKFGLKAARTAPFTNGTYIENIGASDVFFTTAKKLKENEISPILSTPTGLYIIKVAALIPINEEKFQTEKKEFAEKLLAQKKEEHFLSYLEQLKAKIMGKS